MQWLNEGNILVNTDVAVPWWKDDAIIAEFIANGGESPFYSGNIPVAEVLRRLFTFQINSRQACYLEPVGTDHPAVDDQGNKFPTITVNDQKFMVVSGGAARRIGPSDAPDSWYWGTDGYTPHQFDEWLLNAPAKLLASDSSELGIVSAGLLSGRSVAWVQIGIPEWITTPEGIAFRPYIMATSAANGKTSTGYFMGSNIGVCDNTVTAFQNSAEREGRVFKVKHTSNSLIRLSDVHEALKLIDTHAQTMGEAISYLVNTPMSESQWSSVMETVCPLPAESGRGQTMAQNKRDKLDELYRYDIRCQPQGTAWAAAQAVNTFNQHYSTVKGDVHRAERNMLAEIAGKTAEQDASIFAALAKSGALVAA